MGLMASTYEATKARLNEATKVHLNGASIRYVNDLAQTGNWNEIDVRGVLHEALLGEVMPVVYYYSIHVELFVRPNSVFPLVHDAYYRSNDRCGCFENDRYCCYSGIDRYCCSEPFD
jgi:hypothetical protein